ncbi:MAG: 2,3-diphosphoglycerate-dependent phosphoglycerate mutase [Acidimicrobiales bacterium]
MVDLVLLRHGESAWNAQNRFTGWIDVALSDKGCAEAKAAGQLLSERSDLDLRVLHTSLLVRSISTAQIALHEAGRAWLPARRSWRLNERHYGALQGLDKKQTAAKFGEERVKQWRRSYDIRPPELEVIEDADDPRYRDLEATQFPRAECLADVVSRVIPYWQEVVAADLRAEAPHGGGVLVVAHGNSIRALRKHLEKISNDEIVDLEVPTGIPYLVTLDDALAVRSGEYLGDPKTAEAAMRSVRAQAEA